MKREDPLTSERPCQRCGHPKHEHMHYRSGTDCSHVDLVYDTRFKGPLRISCPCAEFIGSRIVWALVRAVAKLSTH